MHSIDWNFPFVLWHRIDWPVGVSPNCPRHLPLLYSVIKSLTKPIPICWSTDRSFRHFSIDAWWFFIRQFEWCWRWHQMDVFVEISFKRENWKENKANLSKLLEKRLNQTALGAIGKICSSANSRQVWSEIWPPSSIRPRSPCIRAKMWETTDLGWWNGKPTNPFSWPSLWFRLNDVGRGLLTLSFRNGF